MHCRSENITSHSKYKTGGQKIAPSSCLSINEESFDGRKILRIYLTERSQIHRCNGRFYDRNEDGDFNITDYNILVTNLYQRKPSAFTENKVSHLVSIQDLRADLIERCRKIARENSRNHHWADMDDMQLAKYATLSERPYIRRTRHHAGWNYAFRYLSVDPYKP